MHIFCQLHEILNWLWYTLWNWWISTIMFTALIITFKRMFLFYKNVSYAVDFSCTVAVLKFWLFIFNYHKIPILNKHPFKNNTSNPLLNNLNLFFFAKYKSIPPLQIFCTRNSFKDLRGKNSQLLTFSQISTFLKDKSMKSLSLTHTCLKFLLPISA